MKYKKEAAIDNGEMILLRSLRPQDAAEVIRVLKKTAGETDFMMRYADEWTITPEKERELLAKAEFAPYELMLGAFMNECLVGIANFRPVHPGDRARHRAQLGVSVCKSYWNRGVGTALMQTLIEAAETTALEQLELSVAAKNEHAQALYTRFGFTEYGRHPHAMKYRSGTYDDLILMLLELGKKA